MPRRVCLDLLELRENQKQTRVGERLDNVEGVRTTVWRLLTPDPKEPRGSLLERPQTPEANPG